MNTPPRLLGPAEVREALGISAPTYFRWLRDGRLKGVRVGGRWKFPRSEVDRLLGRVDPQEVRRAQAIRAAIEAYAERLVGLGWKRKEVEAMAQSQDGPALATLVLSHALDRGATDIHVIPRAEGLELRERINGALSEVPSSLPQPATDDLVRSVKALAGLDVEVTDAPQEGRCFTAFKERQVGTFVSTYPTDLGEALTIRLLDPATLRLRFAELGFGKTVSDQVLRAVDRPNGVFLVNGPTSSGKTTTLYCLLKFLYQPGRKVMTVEDPVEVHLDGLLQANVTERMGFEDAMRAMLRNDLDVAMVSELRTPEVMRLLFQMAASGHLMLSAMHAPDAISAIRRLLDIGKVPSRLLAENLLGVLDQRLVRLSCPHCRAMKLIAATDADRLKLSGPGRKLRVAANRGCDRCQGTGVHDRCLVGALLAPGKDLRAALDAGEVGEEALRAALPANSRTLRDAVLERLAGGDLSPSSAIEALGV
ncbi:MAG: ATPase, T2SS/T4P/T4SS family [Planctomycetota bacterium]